MTKRERDHLWNRLAFAGGLIGLILAVVLLYLIQH